MSDQPAQGQVEGDVNQQASGEQKPKDGVQERIDELTAKYREQERQVGDAVNTIRELRDQNTQLMQVMMQDRQQRAQPSEPEIPEGLDPDIKKTLDAYFQPLNARLQAHEKLIEKNQMTSQVQSEFLELARYAALKKIPADLVESAKEHLIDLRQRGYTKDMASVVDAIQLAAGKRMMNAFSGGPAPVNVPTQLWGGTANAVPPAPQHQQTAQPLPADFERLSLDKQIAYLEARGLDKLPND